MFSDAIIRPGGGEAEMKSKAFPAIFLAAGMLLCADSRPASAQSPGETELLRRHALAEKDIAKARTLMADENYAQAESVLSKVLRERPEHAEAGGVRSTRSSNGPSSRLSAAEPDPLSVPSLPARREADAFPGLEGTKSVAAERFGGDDIQSFRLVDVQRVIDRMA